MPGDVSQWYKDSGYLISTHVGPVVDGEWTNCIPSGKPNSECWTDAPAKVPVYLRLPGQSDDDPRGILEPRRVQADDEPGQ